MNTTTTKQAQKLAALQIEIDLQNKLIELCGIEPSIISPENKPFAVFRPKTKDEYLSILNALQPTEENFTVTFASGNPIETFSPYSIHYGGKHSTPNYMTATVKFNHSVCPIWVDMPNEVREAKFSVISFDGEHKGFGRYETLYTLSANEGRTKVQEYYGKSKTMYASNEAEAEQLKHFIFS